MDHFMKLLIAPVSYWQFLCRSVNFR